MTTLQRFTVRLASASDLDALAPLFDAYRIFYEQPGDLARAHAFLCERLARAESVILVAVRAVAGLLGFCQLYPSWCSISAARVFILSDLFVAPTARRAGVGSALMRAAQAHGRAAGAARLDLSTARTNTRAQALYESLGWVRDEVYLAYTLTLAEPTRPMALATPNSAA